MKKKRKKKKKKNISCPDILIGILLVIVGLYTQKNPQICGKLSEYSDQIMAAGIFFSTIRLAVTILIRRSRRSRLLSADIQRIAEMDGVTFEDCCIEHFRQLGYKAEPTATSGDYGADIILKKMGRKTVVQCKRYKGNVGVQAIQEAIGAKGYYKADKAMVITNSYYTPNAITLANANDVELWDRDDLVKKFKVKE